MIKSVRTKHAMVVLACTTLLAACATSSPIQRYNESKSAFSVPPELISHNIPDKDIYRIYHRAATGFVSIQSIRLTAESRATEFAERQGKSITVLGERISQPPYILGNYPRIEIVFALIERAERLDLTVDKYDSLAKLKDLLDEGALTPEEYENEKAKLLRK